MLLHTSPKKGIPLVGQTLLFLAPRCVSGTKMFSYLDGVYTEKILLYIYFLLILSYFHARTHANYYKCTFSRTRRNNNSLMYDQCLYRAVKLYNTFRFNPLNIRERGLLDMFS